MLQPRESMGMCSITRKVWGIQTLDQPFHSTSQDKTDGVAQPLTDSSISPPCPAVLIPLCKGHRIKLKWVEKDKEHLTEAEK